jgi:hypothetical protein
LIPATVVLPIGKRDAVSIVNLDDKAPRVTLLGQIVT